MNADLRRASILDTAMQMAKADGLDAVKRDALAEANGCAVGTIHWVYKNGMEEVRNAVINRTVEELHESEDPALLHILAQALSERNIVAIAAPEAMKFSALKSLMS